MTKLIAKFLFLVIILSSCFTMAGCSIKIEPKWRSLNTSFMVTIKEVKQQKVIDFEISKDYYFNIKFFGDVDVDDDTHQDIKIEYNEKNAVVTYAYDSPRSKTLTFKIYLYELGSNDTLKITYKGKTIEVGYNVLDYDFEAHGYIAPNSLSDLDKYPEFKEMLLSIKYHEFEEPYIGLNKWDYDIQSDGSLLYSNHFYTSNNRYIPTDYLIYLTDSVYYPEKFIGYSMYMYLPEGTNVNEGANRAIMDSFSLSLMVSDPKHNKRPDFITGMSFSAHNKEKFKYWSSDEYTNPQIILLERYPEKFFQYKMGELTIYILSTKNSGAIAYFTHGNYFYRVSASYDFD